jgi:RNA polymerase sigma-70 factor (ECF subfamily)
VADETATNVARAAFARPALVAGAVGIVVAPQGRLLVALALTVEDGRIAEIDVVADPARLRGLDVAVSPPS